MNHVAEESVSSQMEQEIPSLVTRAEADTVPLISSSGWKLFTISKASVMNSWLSMFLQGGGCSLAEFPCIFFAMGPKALIHLGRSLQKYHMQPIHLI